MGKGREPPTWYFNEPELDRGEDFYLTAFYDLDTCRNIGMDLGAIPWNMILHYAIVHQLDSDMIHPFICIIRAMDSAYQNWHQEKRDKNTKCPAPTASKS